jgi:hypothetical protein
MSDTTIAGLQLQALLSAWPIGQSEIHRACEAVEYGHRKPNDDLVANASKGRVAEQDCLRTIYVISPR